MNIVYYWLTMGPYHYARMNAVQNHSKCSHLHVIEATDTDDHAWNLFPQKNFSHNVLQEGQMLDNSVVKTASSQLVEAVIGGPCDVLVNGAGYFHLSMLKPLMKLKRRGIKIILWSESTEHDQDRMAGKEMIKSLVLKIYDGAIVAGENHKNYLVKLGMSPDRICEVGNVVDNSYFEDHKEYERRGFIYVGRFLDIKNLERLILAYQSYYKKCKADNLKPEPLVLVGDGPTKNEIERKVQTLALEDVEFKGRLQIDEVKKQYAKSKVIILPSLSEPWGLVINEGMASGLAIIASEKCGAAPALVNHGENGFIFNPLDANELAEQMLRLTKEDGLAEKFGERSTDIIKQYSPDVYARRCCGFFKDIVETSQTEE